MSYYCGSEYCHLSLGKPFRDSVLAFRGESEAISEPASKFHFQFQAPADKKVDKKWLSGLRIVSRLF